MKRGRFAILLGALAIGVVAAPGRPVEAGPPPQPEIVAVVGVPGESEIWIDDAGGIEVFVGDPNAPILDEATSISLPTTALSDEGVAYHRTGTAVAVGDLNGDGRDDIVIGAPGAGGGAGRVHVAFRSVATDAVTFDTVTLAQGRDGLVGRSEGEDRFGTSVAIGHRSTGEPWIAIGAPGEKVGSAYETGAVTIVPMQGGVLDRAAAVSFYQGKGGLHGTAEPRDAFGSALAEYGLGGLAVGVPGENVGTIVDAGHVDGFRAAPGGLPGSGPHDRLQQGAGSLWSGTSEAGDRFGAALAGRPPYRLAIGAPGEDLASIDDAGVVYDIGVPGVLHHTTVIQQGDGPDADLVGLPEAGDRFGATLASLPHGLAIGAPAEDVGTRLGAGVVHVIPELAGANRALDFSRDQSFQQDTPGVPGTAEAYDGFGSSLAAGPAALVVGAPYEAVTDGSADPRRAAGSVTMFRTDGWVVLLDPAPEVAVGTADASESYDNFGFAVAAGGG